MAEKRKFAALAELSRQSEKEPAPAEAPVGPGPSLEHERPVAAQELVGRGRGRPATGKRSNPEYKLYAHYLKKRTHRRVAATLAALHAENDQPPDLSDLVQELLEAWLARQEAQSAI
jgi:hypothetical protein